jgi:tetratricopeptide (TPR) repeat protein
MSHPPLTPPGQTSNHTRSSRGSGRLLAVAVPLCVAVLAVAWVVTRNPGAGDAPPAAAGVASPTAAVASNETADAVVRSARAAINQGDVGKALTILDTAAERFPRDQTMLILRAEALLHAGRDDQALRAYEEAIFLGPDRADLRDLAAAIARELGDLEKASQYWARAHTLNPANPKYPLYRAQVQRALGDDDAARASLMLATTLDPEIAVAWGSLGAIALDAGNFSPAMQHIRRARALEPENLTWRTLEARVLRRQGKPREAADRLLAIHNFARAQNPGVLTELALCFALLDDPKSAYDEYERATRLDPSNADTQFEAAVWAERAGLTEAAVEHAATGTLAGHKGCTRLLERLRAE